MADTLGSQCRNLTNAANARLNGSPATADEWLQISRALRTASDKARKVFALAARMEATTTDVYTENSADI